MSLALQSDDDDLELGEASLQSEEAVSTTVSEMVQSHLDDGGTLWTVVWALAGRARWKRLVAVAVVAQLSYHRGFGSNITTCIPGLDRDVRSVRKSSPLPRASLVPISRCTCVKRPSPPNGSITCGWSSCAEVGTTCTEDSSSSSKAPIAARGTECMSTCK